MAAFPHQADAYLAGFFGVASANFRCNFSTGQRGGATESETLALLIPNTQTGLHARRLAKVVVQRGFAPEAIVTLLASSLGRTSMCLHVLPLGLGCTRTS